MSTRLFLQIEQANYFVSVDLSGPTSQCTCVAASDGLNTDGESRMKADSTNELLRKDSARQDVTREVSRETLPAPTGATSGPSSHVVEGDHLAEIRNLAYALYEERGHVDGRDLDDWLEAEDIILQRGKTAA